MEKYLERIKCLSEKGIDCKEVLTYFETILEVREQLIGAGTPDANMRVIAYNLEDSLDTKIKKLEAMGE